jgi:hypothetical protein
MSTNATLRLSIPKPSSLCSRNCSFRNKLNEGAGNNSIRCPEHGKQLLNKKFVIPLTKSTNLDRRLNKPMNMNKPMDSTYKNTFQEKLKNGLDVNTAMSNLNPTSKLNSENFNHFNRQNKFTKNSVNLPLNPRRIVIRERSRSYKNSAMKKLNNMKTTPPDSDSTYSQSKFNTLLNDEGGLNLLPKEFEQKIEYQHSSTILPTEECTKIIEDDMGMGMGMCINNNKGIDVNKSINLKFNHNLTNNPNSLDLIINNNSEDIFSIDLDKDEKLVEICWKDEFVFSQGKASVEIKQNEGTMGKVAVVEDHIGGKKIIQFHNQFDCKLKKSIRDEYGCTKETVEETARIENIEPNQSHSQNFNNYNYNTQSSYNFTQNSLNLTSQSTNSNFLQENINKINLGLFTSNYENLKINKDHYPKFDDNEYRKLLTTVLKLEYGKSILEEYFNNEDQIENCLKKHEINERMRMRMVDWMIEVLNNFKCEDTTYFLAINIMDRFFKSYEKTLKSEDLHIIGICAMFISSKFYDIYPLKLKIIVEKVSHGKFSSDQVKNMEEIMIKSLNYDICKPTIFDFVNLYIEEIFYFFENNFTITDKILSDYLKCFLTSLGIQIKLDHLYYEKFNNTKKYTVQMLSFLKHVAVYLAKLCCHDYSLSCIKPSLTAASIVLVALKICEQINNEEYVNEFFLEKLSNLSRHSQYEILHYGQKILHNAQNFDLLFQGLENLKRIHFNSLLEIKSTK